MVQKPSNAFIAASWIALGAGMGGFFVGLWNAAMLRPEDIREAHMARLEKRAPQFAALRPAGGAI